MATKEKREMSAEARAQQAERMKKVREKGAAPSPYVLEDEPDGIGFATTLAAGGYRGYYRKALDELWNAGGVLRFPSRRPLAQLRLAAKKAGYVLGFASSGEGFLVKIEDRVDPK